MSAYPTLLVGLGEAGADAVRHAFTDVPAAHPGAPGLLSALVVGPDGAHSLSTPADEVGQDPAGPVADLGSGRSGLVRTFRESIEGLLALPNVGAGDVGSGVRVFVAVGLSDPIGTSALIPTLEALRDTRRFFQNTPRQTHVALFTPGRDERGGDGAARAAATVSELELALDHSERASSEGALVDNSWVFSRQNANGFFADRVEDLFPVFSELVGVSLTGRAMGDQSFSGVLRTSVLGRRRRYSAVGHARLVFPRERIVDAALSRVSHRSVQELGLDAGSELSATEAYARSREFIRGLGLGGLVGLLRVDEGDKEIYAPFAPQLPVGDSMGHATLEALRAEAKAFENGDLAAMRRRLGKKRDALSGEHRAAITAEVAQTIDRREPVAAAMGWLDAFEGVSSEHLKGEAEDRPLTLDSLDREVRSFFDSRFEPLLFGEIEDDERSEYVGERSLSRRVLLQRVTLDLETKRRNLERSVGRVDLLRGDVEEARDQVEPADTESGGPDGTEGDRADRAAEGRAAREGRVEELEDRVEEAEGDVSAFEADVVRLARIKERTRDEVAQLDRALTDASQRRYLLDRLQAAFSDDAEEAEGRYRNSLTRERAARAALEDARQRRAGAMVKALVSGAVVSALAYVVVGWLFGWTSTETLSLVGAVVVAALLWTGGVWLWFSSAIRSASEAIEDAVRAREASLRGVVQLYRDHFAHQFEHALFGSLADWREGVRRHVGDLRDALDAFGQDAEAYLRDEPDTSMPEGDPTTEYVSPEGGVDGILDQRSGDVGVRVAEFFRARPPSSLFQEYRAGGPEAIGDYVRDMKGHVEPALGDLRDMSLDNFLIESFSATERVRAVERAYAKAAPFVQISDIGTAVEGAASSGPRVESAVYASVWSPGGANPIKESLEQIGSAPHVHKSEAETEARLLRLGLGYAAFQVAPFVEAYHDLEALPPEERVPLFSSESASQAAFPLVPSEIELGEAGSRHRRAACLALAFGIAEDRGGVAARGGEYPNYASWVKHLRGYHGTGDIEWIERSIEELERKKGKAVLVGRLSGFSLRADMDNVDREILGQEQARLAEI